MASCMALDAMISSGRNMSPQEKFAPTALMAGVSASAMMARASTFAASACSTAARISLCLPR